MRIYQLLICLIVFTNCAAEENLIKPNTAIIVVDSIIKPIDTVKHYLALGDSYTVAESVNPEKSFPAQLVECLKEKSQIELELFATTGWTTTELINALDKGTHRSSYDLVTLLIGVNNQYQGKSFNIYKNEFTDLLERAIILANNNKNYVIVVSIPDYAYTPFGQGRNPIEISKEIDKYNDYAEQTAKARGVKFVNITDITREGLINPELVANDDLHPSGKAYQKFAEKICPEASFIIN